MSLEFHKPRVVVSKCLEFEHCRYNGQIISSPAVRFMTPHVEFLAVCPEVEIGLGVPREPIRVVERDGERRLVQPATGRDVTGEMRDFAGRFLDGLGEVDGFVLKSRSPSCGIKDVKIFAGPEKGSAVGRGAGFFGEAVMSGTTRTFNKAIWESWEQRIDQIVRGVCQAMGTEYELQYTRYYLPTINDAEMARLIGRCAAEVVGIENVVEPEPSMGAEDMSFYLERSKGCFFFLGVGREGSYPIHHPKFDFDEDVLPTGVEIYCRTAFELLGK